MSQDLCLMLERSFTVVGLSGPGITHGCGTAACRGRGTDRHRHLDVFYSDFMADDTVRRATWRSKFAFDDASSNGQPGPGHQAFAHWVASGKMTTVLTQTTDGLHRTSGVADHAIVELHGSDTHARCTFCGVRQALPDLRRRFETTGVTPVCLCGGIVKPDYMMQGEKFSPRDLCRSVGAVETCDLLLVVGSGVRTFPACDLPVLAKDCGAGVVVVNRDPTPVDAIADLVIRADVADVLETFSSYAAHR